MALGLIKPKTRILDPHFLPSIPTFKPPMLNFGALPAEKRTSGSRTTGGSGAAARLRWTGAVEIHKESMGVLVRLWDLGPGFLALRCTGSMLCGVGLIHQHRGRGTGSHKYSGFRVSRQALE